MPFSPSDIAGLQLWVKADQIAGNDGDSVSTWSDQSGSSRHLTEVTAGQDPILKKAANGINSQNVVRFDGSNDVLAFLSTSIIQNLGATTMALVFRAANTTQDGTTPFLISTASAGSTRAAFFFGLSADGKLNVGGRRLDADTSQFLQGGNKSTSPTFALAYFDWTNSDLTLYENGTQTGQTLSFQTSGNTENTASAEICVGAANSVAAAAAFNGDVAEIIIYNSILSSTDRNLLGGYIQTKYALTIAGAVGDASPVQRLRRVYYV